MYTKEQASQIRHAFWTTFGQYMAPIRSAEGTKVNWINYKTGVKHVYFRMQAEKRKAWIAIEIAHPDPGIQELFFEQFLEFRNILHEYLTEEWEWLLHTTDDYGKQVSRIYKEMNGVNVFDEKHWPELISFFKPRMLSLDMFWSDVKYSFDALK
ncbi:DUF4268 domain-containing protein [Arcticibacter sp. MXS-1]|uniref:DUF4268 domain-containing protein n=1 Tax=Arcticibacter sp. MXS-1 TaxID=3341726 RepID=UPI0035A84DE9